MAAVPGSGRAAAPSAEAETPTGRAPAAADRARCLRAQFPRSARSGPVRRLTRCSAAEVALAIPARAGPGKRSVATAPLAGSEDRGASGSASQRRPVGVGSRGSGVPRMGPGERKARTRSQARSEPAPPAAPGPALPAIPPAAAGRRPSSAHCAPRPGHSLTPGAVEVTGTPRRRRSPRARFGHGSFSFGLALACFHADRTPTYPDGRWGQSLLSVSPGVPVPTGCRLLNQAAFLDSIAPTQEPGSRAQLVSVEVEPRRKERKPGAAFLGFKHLPLGFAFEPPQPRVLQRSPDVCMDSPLWKGAPVPEAHIIPGPPTPHD